MTDTPDLIRRGDAVKSLRDWQDSLNEQRMPDTAITIGMAADLVAALPSVGVTVNPGQIERLVWDAMVWAASTPTPRPGVNIPAYTDKGNSDAEVECRATAARILAALDVRPAPSPSPDVCADAQSRTDQETALSPDVAARIYLDLDGVMADFDAHFPAVFGVDHRGMADDAMWERINNHPSYFEDMPLCAGAKDFFDTIRHMAPIILTACPKTNYAHVAAQKKRWVQKHLGDFTVLPVMGGHNKCLFMHKPGDVLIDDYEKNCRPWEKMGGIAILHKSFPETCDALAAALARVKGGA